jgi:hypothetical protein
MTRAGRLAGAAAACLLALAAAPAEAGPKVDTVVLKNGNRITCEIKGFDRARLTLSTDPMDTVTVHWDHVAQLASPRTFEIETTSGATSYGALAAAPDGDLGVVQHDGSLRRLRLGDVIRLTPIGASVWERMDGNIDLGFSFSQANLETRWTLNSSTSYRSRRYEVEGSLASQLTRGEDTADLSRNTLTLSARRFIGDRWFTLAIVQLQQNEELSLDLRALGGGGLGRYFSQTNRRRLSGVAGVVFTHERFSGESPASSAEGVAGATLDFFSPKDSDFTFTNSVVSFYKLGSPGRARLELQSALRYEFFKDFYWSINGFESFDSRPPEGEKRNDAGVSVALGWKF